MTGPSPVLHVLSDLHLDVSGLSSMRGHSAPEETDVVVLAGDVHPGVLGVMWAAETFPRLPVLYVPGNHEYYGRRALDRHPRKMRDKAMELNAATGSDVRVSDRDVHEILGTRFVCATLWTDYALFGDARTGMLHALRGSDGSGSGGMNDYRGICATLNRNLRPVDLAREHAKSLAFLEATLSEPFKGPTVVVTHHAPSALSLGGFREDPMSPCYASSLEHLMEGKGAPELWIHGHIHASQDYDVGRTRVLANPRGYVDHTSVENAAFDPGMTRAAPQASPFMGRLAALLWSCIRAKHLFSAETNWHLTDEEANRFWTETLSELQRL